MFKDTLKYILKSYYYKKNYIKRRDYITKTCIIVIEKYKNHKEKNIIDHDPLKNELGKTISYMTGKINLNVVNEIINSIEEEEKEKKDKWDEDMKEFVNEIHEQIDIEIYLILKLKIVIKISF